MGPSHPGRLVAAFSYICSLKDAVLFDQVLDQFGLVAAYPAGEGQKQGPKGMESSHRRVILGRCK